MTSNVSTRYTTSRMASMPSCVCCVCECVCTLFSVWMVVTSNVSTWYTTSRMASMPSCVCCVCECVFTLIGGGNIKCIRMVQQHVHTLAHTGGHKGHQCTHTLAHITHAGRHLCHKCTHTLAHTCTHNTHSSVGLVRIIPGIIHILYYL